MCWIYAVNRLGAAISSHNAATQSASEPCGRSTYVEDTPEQAQAAAMFALKRKSGQGRVLGALF